MKMDSSSISCYLRSLSLFYPKNFRVFYQVKESIYYENPLFNYIGYIRMIFQSISDGLYLGLISVIGLKSILHHEAKNLSSLFWVLMWFVLKFLHKIMIKITS